MKMEIKLICLLLIAYVIILVVAENNPHRKKLHISIDDNLESEEFEGKNHKRNGRVITVRSENDEFREMETEGRGEEMMNESHEKILEFGKRVVESVNEFEIFKNETNLIESGEYRIDWWKNDRRLEKIRKRLNEELARMPELNNHLNRLGWRNTSKNSSRKKKNHSRRLEIKRSVVKRKNSGDNSFLNKIMTMSFAELLNLDTTQLDQETTDSQPIIFVYMKIMLSKSSKIDGIDRTEVTDTPESSVKFSLDANESQDFKSSDVGVIDIESPSLPISNSVDGSTPTTNSGGESIDTDRVLQLIPLIIDELRNDRFDIDERRSLNWIFGKRLWQLLERDAWKNPVDMMDKELALFLVKGELPERDSMRSRRRLRQSGRLPLIAFRNRRLLDFVGKKND